MEQYAILARSVTYAQRMQRLLGQAGIHCQIFRAPRELSDLGCAYILRLHSQTIRQALTILYRERLEPVRVYSENKGGYQEVELHDLF